MNIKNGVSYRQGATNRTHLEKAMKRCLMSSALITCPSIGKRRIQRNDEARALIVDGMLKRFTPTEYRLLVLLLEGQPIPDADLVKQVSSYRGRFASS